MKKVFAEIGLGNGSFLSTEFEEGDGENKREYRIPKFIRPEKIYDYHLRFWIFKWMLILSTKDGILTRRKDRNKFKILFGVGGETADI